MANNSLTPHPGQLLNDRIVKANELTQAQTAELLGITETYLSYVLKGKRDLSYNLCHRLEIVFGENAEELAVAQSRYNIEKTAEKFKKLDLKPFIK